MFRTLCTTPCSRLPLQLARAQVLTPSRAALASSGFTYRVSPRPRPVLRRCFAAASASSDPGSPSPTSARDQEQKELHGDKPVMPFEPPHVPHAGGIASKGKPGSSSSALDASQLFTNTGFDTSLKTEDKQQQLVLTQVQADELETKLRYFEYQQRKLQDDFDRHRKLQLLNDHENRRFWIIVLIFVLLLEVSLPLLYYYNSEEMDPDLIPERFLGLWESDLATGAPAALLKITEDGRVNYRRPQVLDPPVVGRAFRGRLRSLLPTKMQVNVLGTLVYDEIALDGPPRQGPDGKLRMRVDGVELVRQDSSRSANMLRFLPAVPPQTSSTTASK